MSSEVFKHVLYLKDWKVLVCLHETCQCGLSPKSVFRHFQTCHKDVCELSLRQEIAKYAETLGLADPSTVTSPNLTNFSSPITGLKTWSRGWQCRQCHKCGPIESGAEKHCKQTHEWSEAQGDICFYN